MTDENSVTLLLQRASAGSETAEVELYQLLYEELRASAKNVIWDNVDPEIQPTVLVHQFYLKLQKSGRWEPRTFQTDEKYAITAMQRILLDHQKKKAGEKIDVPELDVVVSRIEKETGYDIERLHGALDALKESSPKQHE